MEISQAFNPFEYTVSNSGTNWVFIILAILIAVGVGYYLYKNQSTNDKSIL